MKKAMLALTLTLALVGVQNYSDNDVMAKTKKDSVKIQVLKAVNGVKSGKYTYYLDKTTLKRAKKNAKAKVIVKKADRFKLSGKYVFYNKGTKLYRIKKDGTGKSKLIAKHCNHIQEIKGNRIIYAGAYGKFTVKTDGKGNKKIFSYSQGFTRVGDRLYYEKDICNEKGEKTGIEIRSKKMDGTDDVSEKVFDHKDVFTYVADNRFHVLCRDWVDCTKIQISTKQTDGTWSVVENKCPYFFDHAGVVDDKLFFFYSGTSTVDPEKGLEASTKLYQLNADGSQTEYLDLEANKMLCFYNLGDFYTTGKYLVMEDYGDDGGHAYYIIDKKTKKVIKKIGIGKFAYDDEEHIKIKIIGSKVYVMRGGNGGKTGYNIYQLK